MLEIWALGELRDNRVLLDLMALVCLEPLERQVLVDCLVEVYAQPMSVPLTTEAVRKCV